MKSWLLRGLSLLAMALAGCAVSPPPGATQEPVPTADVGTALSVPELKLKLLEKYADFFYCDPDLYPVARADELSLALERWGLVTSDPALFSALARSLKLEGIAGFTDEQKLATYRAYKRVNAVTLKPEGDGYTFAIRVAPGAGTQGFAVEGTLGKSGSIAETGRRPTITTCPICLPAGTSIATPTGPVQVQDLTAGMFVWTRGDSGERVAVALQRVERTAVPTRHQLARVRLSDGRSILASPGHPSIEGVPLGTLRAGDLLDGAIVTQVERVPMIGEFTYDLLPASESGAYWADGVLVRSTLK